jgi:hypothetical protein
MKELQPGRMFVLTPTFPAGFELPAGQRVEVSVKSNHPKHPVIRVPVVQTRQVARSPGGDDRAGGRSGANQFADARGSDQDETGCGWDFV